MDPRMTTFLSGLRTVLPVGRQAPRECWLIRLGAVACSLGVFASVAHAAVISHEAFSYAADTPLNGKNGGTGWQSAWSGAGTVFAAGRAFPGLVTSGNALRAVGNNLASVRSFTPTGFAELRTNGRFGLDGTELWLSFLARRDTDFTIADFAGLTLADGGSQELFVGCVAGASRWSMQLLDLGGAPGNTTPAANAPLVTGETALLVLRLRFGVSGTQDRVELFVNPPPGVTPTTPDAARTGADIRFNQVRLQSGSSRTAAMSFDELRLGESFADVVPTTAGPALAWLRDGPQRVTAGAELTLPLHHNWPAGDAATLALAVTAAARALLPPDRIVLTGTGANRRVTFRPPAGTGGTIAITATLTPPGGAAASASFDLTIGATPTEALLAYEGFDYTPVSTPLLQKNGGLGFAGPWTTGVQGAFGSAAIMAADSLAYPGLASQGLHARVPNSSSHGVLRATALPLGEDGTVRYLSFLARPDALGTAYLGLRLIGSAGADLFAGKPGGGSALRYVLENAGGAGQFPTAKEVRLNTTALLVLKLEFRPGLDRVSLYVDPPLAGAEPGVADAVKMDLDLGLVAAVAFNSSPAWAADELRVGTTFASVTPPGADFRLLRPPNGNAVEHAPFTIRILTSAPLPDGRTLTFELVGETFGATINAATGEFSWTPGELEGGQTRSFNVRATSNATPPGMATTTFHVQVTEGNLPPQLAEILDQTVTEGSEFTYRLEGTDTDHPPQNLSYALGVKPGGMTVSTAGVISWWPTLAQTGISHPVTAFVRDTAFAQASRSFNVHVSSRIQVVARWIGAADGDWNNPANWDIGRVPNDTATEFFNVIWDDRPVTIRVAGNVNVRRLRWTSGGALDLLPGSQLTLQDTLHWNGGTLAGAGRLTVQGRAELAHSRTHASTLRGQCQLALRGGSRLETLLRCDGDVRLIVEPTGTLDIGEATGFLWINGVPELRNEGTISVFARDNRVPFIFLRNHGRVHAYASTLDFMTGAPTNLITGFTHLIQEPGGHLGLGAGVDEEATLVAKVEFKDGSTVSGQAHIREAHARGQMQGRLRFDQLSFGPAPTNKFGLVDPPDHLSTQSALALAGRLEIVSRTGFMPGPEDAFEIVRSTGGITGEFSNVPFGQRVQLPNGGSMRVTLSEDSRAVVLRGYLPRAEYLGSVPLNFLMPAPDVPVGGCFVVPHPAVNLPEGDWAGGSLTVEITDGFDEERDRLEFRRNPAFPESDEIVFAGPPDGAQSVRFRGAEFGTAMLTGKALTCALFAQADSEAVVALLGRLFYRNTELTAGLFTEVNLSYPGRTLVVTLTDAQGMVNPEERVVSFPFLWGLRLPESVELATGEEETLHLQGWFSNGQELPVPNLPAKWADGACGVLQGNDPDTASPGPRRVKGLSSRYCCSVTAQAGEMLAITSVYAGDPVLVTRDEIYGVGNPNPPTLLQFALMWVLGGFRTVSHEVAVEAIVGQCPTFALAFYRDPDPCETTPAARASLHASGNHLPHAPAPMIFYSLETLMQETVSGRRWADLYRQHGGEVVRLFFLDASLLAQGRELLAAYSPGIVALLAGKADTVTITPAMITQVNGFWNALARQASPALKAALEQEQVRFNGFQSFSGRTFAHWAGLLGIPVPSQPRLHISLTRREGDRFHLALNDVPGAEVVLWRSADLKTWQRVSTAEVHRDGVSQLFTDPAAPAGEAFYTVRP